MATALSFDSTLTTSQRAPTDNKPSQRARSQGLKLTESETTDENFINLRNFNPDCKRDEFLNSPRSIAACQQLGVVDKDLLRLSREDIIKEGIPPQFKDFAEDYIEIKMKEHESYRQILLNQLIYIREKMIDEGKGKKVEALKSDESLEISSSSPNRLKQSSHLDGRIATTVKNVNTEFSVLYRKEQIELQTSQSRQTSAERRNMERERQAREAEERKVENAQTKAKKLEDLMQSRVYNRRAAEYQQLQNESRKLMDALQMHPVEEKEDELVDSSLTSDVLVTKRAQVSKLRIQFMEDRYGKAQQMLKEKKSYFEFKNVKEDQKREAYTRVVSENNLKTIEQIEMERRTRIQRADSVLSSIRNQRVLRVQHKKERSRERVENINAFQEQLLGLNEEKKQKLREKHNKADVNRKNFYEHRALKIAEGQVHKKSRSDATLRRAEDMRRSLEKKAIERVEQLQQTIALKEQRKREYLEQQTLKAIEFQVQHELAQKKLQRVERVRGSQRRKVLDKHMLDDEKYHKQKEELEAYVSNVRVIHKNLEQEKRRVLSVNEIECNNNSGKSINGTMSLNLNDSVISKKPLMSPYPDGKLTKSEVFTWGDDRNKSNNSNTGRSAISPRNPIGVVRPLTGYLSPIKQDSGAPSKLVSSMPTSKIGESRSVGKVNGNGRKFNFSPVKVDSSKPRKDKDIASIYKEKSPEAVALPTPVHNASPSKRNAHKDRTNQREILDFASTDSSEMIGYLKNQARIMRQGTTKLMRIGGTNSFTENSDGITFEVLKVLRNDEKELLKTRERSDPFQLYRTK